MRGSLNHAAPLPCECFILKCAFLEILRKLSNNSFHMQSSIRFTQSSFCLNLFIFFALFFFKKKVFKCFLMERFFKVFFKCF